MCTSADGGVIDYLRLIESDGGQLILYHQCGTPMQATTISSNYNGDLYVHVSYITCLRRHSLSVCSVTHFYVLMYVWLELFVCLTCVIPASRQGHWDNRESL